MGDPEQISEDTLVLQCSSFSDLKKSVKKIDIEDLPTFLPRPFPILDAYNDSLPIFPEDIPLKPNNQLYPYTIYGDGNCIPRSVILLAHGTENNYKEMRKRMVIELTRKWSKLSGHNNHEKGKRKQCIRWCAKNFCTLFKFVRGPATNKKCGQKYLWERSLRNLEVWCIYGSLANSLSGKYAKMSSSVCCPNLRNTHS